MKLSLNYLSLPWYRRQSIWLCFFSVSGLIYTLWDREKLLEEYNLIQIAENEELNELNVQPQHLVQKQPSVPPEIEKQIIQISKELTLPRNEMLDALQVALVPNIVLTEIILDEQSIVEGIAIEEMALKNFIQALESSPSWEIVEIESEEMTTPDSQVEMAVQNSENNPSGKGQTKFKLNLKWKRL